EADEIAGLLLEVNARRCTPPLAEREVAAIAKSIGGYPAGCPVVVGQEVFKRAWRRAAKRRSSWRALTLK
ncbi:MAG: hypothetical protein NZ899_15035, partial [Thermoguttaceae bacterium]|nr:hypothetical protein [Thermoguttaceae bacterium]